MTDDLQALFAARLAALERSAGPSDWSDVRRKAGRLAARRLALRLGSGAAVALLAVVAATPALGLRGHLVHLFTSGKPAPTRVIEDFAQLDIAAPAGMAPGVIADEAREVMEVPLSTGENAVMIAAPTRSGGFCLELSTNGPARGGGGGCDRDRLGRFSPGLSIPEMSPDGAIERAPVVIDGSTLVASAAKVAIVYQDGQVGNAPVVWVSKPIDAGFFVYEVPRQHWAAGHRPVRLVLEDDDGHELARKDLPWPSPPVQQDGVPTDAIASQRRELMAITSEQGTREALWVAPSRTGGVCHWLTTDGRAGRSAGCSAGGAATPADELAVGLLSGAAPILFDGEVGAHVATVELRYQDGDVQRVQPVEGFVLAEVPSRHWPKGHRLDAIVALDASGRAIARQPFDTETPGTYPCTKPVELGHGVAACP